MNRKQRWTKSLVVALAGLMALAPAALADPCSGPQIGTHIVSAHDARSFNQCFWGGEWARIVVMGDGDTDLDVYVYDPSGNLVGSDTDDTDWCEVSWFAYRGGMYRIVVRNRGGVYNEFTIQAD